MVSLTLYVWSGGDTLTALPCWDPTQTLPTGSSMSSDARLPDPSTAPLLRVTPGRMTHLSATILPASSTTGLEHSVELVMMTEREPKMTSSPISKVIINSEVIGYSILSIHVHNDNDSIQLLNISRGGHKYNTTLYGTVQHSTEVRTQKIVLYHI